jgi:hypothetical protein
LGRFRDHWTNGVNKKGFLVKPHNVIGLKRPPLGLGPITLNLVGEGWLKRSTREAQRPRGLNLTMAREIYENRALAASPSIFFDQWGLVFGTKYDNRTRKNCNKRNLRPQNVSHFIKKQPKKKG